MGRRVGRVVSSAVLCGAVAVATVMASGSATGAPVADGGIHPGVATHTAGAQCTSNFVFTDDKGIKYLGQAAHCSGTGQATETDGCTSQSLPIGTPVEIEGASQPGTLVYNSWLAMQAAGESDPDTCAYNDFALVRVADADQGKVTAGVPAIGGPSGIAAAPGVGQAVQSYGNSELRAGISLLSPKVGTVTANEGNGWSYTVLTATPGIPGDSGSGFLAGGQAFGVLSTLNFAPVPGTNGVSDLGRLLAYASSHGAGGVRLVTA